MNRIRAMRNARNMTQEELAEKVNTTKQQIWRLENGQRQLTQEWLVRLSKALNCSIVDLLVKRDDEDEEFAFLTEEEKNLIRTFRKYQEEAATKDPKSAKRKIS